MKTDKCEFTIGVNPGYHSKYKFFHNAKYYIKGIINSRKFISRIQTASRFVRDMTGIYVSWDVKKQKTVYAPEWGCPPKGECTYVLSAVRNPLFETDSDKWKDAVSRCIKALKKLNNQTTVSVCFSEVDFQYFTNKPINTSTATETYFLLIILPIHCKRAISDIIKDVASDTNSKIMVGEITEEESKDKYKSPAQVIVDQYTARSQLSPLIYKISITSNQHDCVQCKDILIKNFINAGYFVNEIKKGE